MEKQYNPSQVEERWYAYWAENKMFHADENSSKPAYSIVIPPPNVTGVLHMGHALNNTIQDVLIRYKKMTGHEVLWMPGTDHAGIATQMLLNVNWPKSRKRPVTTWEERLS
jgi:valyl-tRNA synthetase